MLAKLLIYIYLHIRHIRNMSALGLCR